MDFIKNAVSNATKGEGQGQKTDAPAQGGNANAQASGSSSSGQMDYVDKGESLTYIITLSRWHVLTNE